MFCPLNFEGEDSSYFEIGGPNTKSEKQKYIIENGVWAVGEKEDTQILSAFKKNIWHKKKTTSKNLNTVVPNKQQHKTNQWQ